MMALPPLQRDLREVENELRLARLRWQHYLTLDEYELARNSGAVVLALESLRDTLTAHIQLFTHASSQV